MDILKLLSRSTKQDHKVSTVRDREAVKLPSAATPANPQLFHDVVPDIRGKKRKRRVETAAEETHDNNEEDFDFFAEKRVTPKSSKASSSKEAAARNVELAELLSSEECRNTLRSHRLKLTLLSAGKSEKRVKKSKKSKASKKDVSGKDGHRQLYPQPLQAFSELRSVYNLSTRMSTNLADQGYTIPTEVQMGSLPMLLDPEIAFGDDVAEIGGLESDLIAVAPTGSGKTLAFLIPILNQIIQRRRKHEDKKERLLESVVVAPTKELAGQIVNEAKKLSQGTGVKVLAMTKGMVLWNNGEEQDEKESLVAKQINIDSETSEDSGTQTTSRPKTKADILVTTPGLLFAAITTVPSGNYRPLANIKSLVLDEADVLLDPLSQDQTLGIWQACTSPDLRVTLWSATMGSNIESLTSTIINERCTKLSIPSRPLIRLVVGLKDSALPTITHTVTYTATEPGKLLALRQLLHPTGSSSKSTCLRPPFLVFTQTIPRAVALHAELLYDNPPSAGGPSRIAVLHSDLSSTSRADVMTRFRNGEVWVLITTDLLSRGIDFRGVNGVVNYDIPNSVAAYIHRAGRTGRAGREGGVAVTFYTKEDIPYMRGIANVIAASDKAAGRPPEEASLQSWLLKALPKTTKEEKKQLKLHGIEARRSGIVDTGKQGKKNGREGKSQAKISTKSGYERQLENRRRGAIEGSRRRKEAGGHQQGQESGGEESEWGGLDD